MKKAGRPKLPKSQRKVKTEVWLKPKTIKVIDESIKKKSNTLKSRGEVIDNKFGGDE